MQSGVHACRQPMPADTGIPIAWPISAGDFCLEDKMGSNVVGCTGWHPSCTRSVAGAGSVLHRQSFPVWTNDALQRPLWGLDQCYAFLLQCNSCCRYRISATQAALTRQGAPARPSTSAAGSGVCCSQASGRGSGA